MEQKTRKKMYLELTREDYERLKSFASKKGLKPTHFVKMCVFDVMNA